jgi:acetyl-CoA carboxylase biotin carboxyl carrier protein
MDLRKIKKLIDLLEESNLSEIEIKEGEESVRLARHSQPVAGYHPAPPAPHYSQHEPAPRGNVSQGMASPVEAATGGRQSSELPDGHVVRAPMVGTFGDISRRRVNRQLVALVRRKRTGGKREHN